MSYARMVSIDPGLAQLGWAAFDVTGLTKHPKPELLAGRCLAYGSVKTLPQTETVTRLSDLRDATIEAVFAAGCMPGETMVVIEKPGRPGGYMRRSGDAFAAMAGGMAGLWLATGTLVGGFGQAGYAVEFRAPNARNKQERWEKAVGLLTPMPAGRTNKESRDALWLGCQVMLDGRRLWAPVVPAAS